MAEKKSKKKFAVPAIITMVCVHDDEIMNDSADFELTTKGVFSRDGDRFSISYEDSEATGFENSTTIIEVEGAVNASVRREGETPSELILETEKKHHCHYGTPYGNLMLGVYTKLIDNRLGDKGGKLELRYVIDSNGAFVSENWINLSVEPENV
ncbi:DUF1934 domain-containing protein [Ruminococcus sp. HUN007]|uniref:DUF1934 domain-containing protein n=1 Tax=Ruminococcus sp. HUN007 TaxID=1514668 RepID=UPI0006795BFE|nr:DUF1934 domain-containing protein [Ruminococcus sp. HUN007]